MNTLKTKEKERLICMLKEAYGDVKEERFINALTDSPEEKAELTLLAYSIKKTSQQKTVIVIKCSAKLQFIKTIKEIAKVGLIEAKDFADNACPRDGIYHPVKVGDDCIISIEKWEEIAKVTKSFVTEFEWAYIQYN